MGSESHWSLSKTHIIIKMEITMHIPRCFYIRVYRSSSCLKLWENKRKMELTRLPIEWSWPNFHQHHQPPLVRIAFINRLQVAAGKNAIRNYIKTKEGKEMLQNCKVINVMEPRDLSILFVTFLFSFSHYLRVLCRELFWDHRLVH